LYVYCEIDAGVISIYVLSGHNEKHQIELSREITKSIIG